jgi:UDP-glucose 4-epimerase
MRVLLTGAAGLIGRVSAQLFDDRGHEVLATDLHPLSSDFEGLAWQRMDVRRPEHVRRTLGAFAPDAVVHLAAKHFIPWCERFPAGTLKTNVLGTQNVIDGARHARVRKLVFASSAAVYGPSSQPLAETSGIGPDDVYGTSKVMAEQLLGLALRREHDFDAIVLRLFNTIGPGDGNPHLVPRLLAELRDGGGHDRGGGRVRLGNLTSVRDYIYVEDVARAIVAAVERDLPGLSTINVGSGRGRSVGEVVQTLADLLAQPLQVVSVATQRRTVDRPILMADIARARTLLGWEPHVSFEEGLARTLHAELVPA